MADPTNPPPMPMPERPSSPKQLESVADRSGELLQRAVEVAREFPRPLIIEALDPRDNTKAPLIISPLGVSKVDPSHFDAYREQPLERTGTVTLTTLASFIDITNRFKLPESAIFARDNMTAAQLTAVFDYHPEVTDVTDAASNMRHRASYSFPFSDEWKAWIAKNGEIMGMADFAAFLEDRIVDVDASAEPASEAAKAFVSAIDGRMASPSKLIELARGLQVYENSVVKEARNLSSGEGQLTFDSQHTDADGKPLMVPNLFMICVPIFARSPDSYRLIARLRYRKANGGIAFWYELWRPDLAFEQAFQEACDQVRAATELPLFVGAPEA